MLTSTANHWPTFNDTARTTQTMNDPLTLLSVSTEARPNIDNNQKVTTSQDKMDIEWVVVTSDNLNPLSHHCHYGNLNVGDWVVKRVLSSGEVRMSGPFQSLEVAKAYIHSVSHLD